MIVTIVTFAILISIINTEINNLNLNSVDLIEQVELQNGQRTHIKAFKGVSNEEIINSRDESKYSHLYWASFGYPQLMEQSNNSKYLKFNRRGFYISINTLTPNYKEMLAKRAQLKYNITNISTQQIHYLIIKSFKCKTTFYELNSPYLKMDIEGKGINLQEIPLRVYFNLPFFTKERKKLEEIIQNNISLTFECESSLSGDLNNPYNHNDSFNKKYTFDTEFKEIGNIF
jgi:hypothetical protein